MTTPPQPWERCCSRISPEGSCTPWSPELLPQGSETCGERYKILSISVFTFPLVWALVWAVFFFKDVVHKASIYSSISIYLAVYLLSLLYVFQCVCIEFLRLYREILNKWFTKHLSIHLLISIYLCLFSQCIYFPSCPAPVCVHRVLETLHRTFQYVMNKASIYLPIYFYLSIRVFVFRAINGSLLSKQWAPSSMRLTICTINAILYLPHMHVEMKGPKLTVRLSSASEGLS